MNNYRRQFEKYKGLTMRMYFSEYLELIELVQSVIASDSENVKANAVVVFGFSGNGKSTWAKDFIKRNPDYTLVSMNSTINRLYDEYDRPVSEEEIINGFGDDLEEVCSTHKNIVIDGNFLNLLTRSALCDTLKSYDYQINVVDITDNINETLQHRVLDIASFRLGKKIDKSNIDEYICNPRFNEIKDLIVTSYYDERKSNNVDEQLLYDVVGLGVNKVFTKDDDYDEIARIVQTQK